MRQNIPSSYPKVSNRERMRRADAAVAHANKIIEHSLLQVGRIQHVLLSLLAQKGGEITVTEATMAQITSKMSFETTLSEDKKEVTFRLLTEVDDAALLDDATDDAVVTID